LRKRNILAPTEKDFEQMFKSQSQEYSSLKKLKQLDVENYNIYDSRSGSALSQNDLENPENVQDSSRAPSLKGILGLR
jgi:hypothetical protein